VMMRMLSITMQDSVPGGNRTAAGKRTGQASTAGFRAFRHRRSGAR
jgi:hypothetical protein